MGCSKAALCMPSVCPAAVITCGKFALFFSLSFCLTFCVGWLCFD